MDESQYEVASGADGEAMDGTTARSCGREALATSSAGQAEQLEIKAGRSVRCESIGRKSWLVRIWQKKKGIIKNWWKDIFEVCG